MEHGQHVGHKPLLDVLETASSTHSSALLFNLLEMTDFGIQSDVRKQKLDPFFLFQAVIRGGVGAAIFSFPSHITLLRFSLWGFSLPLGKKNPGKIICTFNF